MTAARYPADRGLKRLIAELTSHSPRFAELWESGEADLPQDQSRHKIIDHPDAGLIALDCGTLIVAGDDLRIMVYTAEPGTEDAERLALAMVLGTQTLAGWRTEVKPGRVTDRPPTTPAIRPQSQRPSAGHA